MNVISLVELWLLFRWAFYFIKLPRHTTEANTLNSLLNNRKLFWGISTTWIVEKNLGILSTQSVFQFRTALQFATMTLYNSFCSCCSIRLGAIVVGVISMVRMQLLIYLIPVAIYQNLALCWLHVLCQSAICKYRDFSIV